MLRILAATDFSQSSQPVLDYAAKLTQRSGGKMYLLHVVVPGPDCGVGMFSSGDLACPYPAMEAPPMEMPGVLLEQADRTTKEIGAKVSDAWGGLDYYAKAEESENVVDCILQFCKRHNITMIAIGNRHHSLLSSILLGSTAEKLIRHAHIPVTVVPCAEE